MNGIVLVSFPIYSCVCRRREREGMDSPFTVCSQAILWIRKNDRREEMNRKDEEEMDKKQ